MFTANSLLSVILLTMGVSVSSLAAQAAPLQLNPQSGITVNHPTTLSQRRRRKRFVPPKLRLDRGIPTAGRSHNASRGCRQAKPDLPGLTLLVPEYVDRLTHRQGQEIESRYAMGLTAVAQPSFWAYVAVDEAAEAVSLEFVLRDAKGRKVYREILAVPERSGMVRIAPEAMPPLKAGVDYHWFLKQKSRCHGAGGLVRENGEAWIRYEPSVIEESSEETGYWYDVLDGAAGDAAAFGELLEAIGVELPPK